MCVCWGRNKCAFRKKLNTGGCKTCVIITALSFFIGCLITNIITLHESK